MSVIGSSQRKIISVNNIIDTKTLTKYKKRFMDEQETVVRFPTVVKYVSHLQNVQTVARAHPGTCSVDTRSPFSGIKEAGV